MARVGPLRTARALRYSRPPPRSRDTPETSASEELGEVGDLDGVLARGPGGARDGQRRGEGPRGAHAEPPADRKPVGDLDVEAPPERDPQASGDLGRDGEVRGLRRLHAQSARTARPPVRRRLGPALQNDAGADGAAPSRVRSARRRSEEPGDVPGGECPRSAGTRPAVDLPQRYLAGTASYKVRRMSRMRTRAEAAKGDRNQR